MKLDKQNIKEFLKIHNKLKIAIQNIDETKDLYLTDIREIENSMFYIRHLFGFKSPKGDYYVDYVLKEDAKQ